LREKSYMTDWVCLSVIYNETVGLQARSFTIPAKYNSAKVNLRWKCGKSWLLATCAQTKI